MRLTRCTRPPGREKSSRPISPKANSAKNAATVRFTQGLVANWLTPVAPSRNVSASPVMVEVRTIPAAKSRASLSTLPVPRELAPVKNDTVTGIMGNTQGVNRASRPKPAASSRNPVRPPASALSRESASMRKFPDSST